MTPREARALGVVEGLRALESGALSAEAWAEALLDGMAAGRRLGAFLCERREEALEEARAADRRRAEGAARPLEGLPLAAKDLFCTAGTPTTAGSRMLEGWTPPYESTVTARLRAAGAVLLGKTNLDEFGMGSSGGASAFGPTLNPWGDPERPPLSPGGSSSGSAAAVAARMAPAALGTDTGGSVRQPASFCGVVGFKPTYGRLSRWGVIAYASSLDQPGLIVRRAEDAAPLLSAASGRDPLDSTSADRPPTRPRPAPVDLSGLRIGMPKECRAEGLPVEIAAIWQRAAERAREEGAEVAAVSLPRLEDALAAYYVIAPAEASSNLARYDGLRFGRRAPGPHADLDAMYEASRAEGFGPEVKRRILAGTHVLSAGWRDAFYNHARRVRALVARDFALAFQEVDLLLCPVAPSAAFPLEEEGRDPGWMYLQDAFTTPASLAGLPAVSLPAELTRAGLPVGVQLIAPAFEDERLLSAASALEEALGFDAAPPWGVDGREAA